jgi:hypothetical protein
MRISEVETLETVIPAKAGIPLPFRDWRRSGIPAFAGMTLLVLMGCNSENANDAARQAVASDDRIACQPAGAETLEPVCTIERSASEKGLILTIRHPDASFRRLLVTKDGRGVIAADGAEQAKVRIADTIGKGSEIEVTLAGNRYILPATLKP